MRTSSNRLVCVGVQVPYEQLRLLLEERTSECEVLRNRLEQREASLEVMRRNYEGQVSLYGLWDGQGHCWMNTASWQLMFISKQCTSQLVQP